MAGPTPWGPGGNSLPFPSIADVFAAMAVNWAAAAAFETAVEGCSLQPVSSAKAGRVRRMNMK